MSWTFFFWLHKVVWSEIILGLWKLGPCPLRPACSCWAKLALPGVLLAICLLVTRAFTLAAHLPAWEPAKPKRFPDLSEQPSGRGQMPLFKSTLVDGSRGFKSSHQEHRPCHVVGKAPVLEANAAVSRLRQRAYGLYDKWREIQCLGVGWCHGHFSAAPEGRAAPWVTGVLSSPLLAVHKGRCLPISW